MNQHLLARSKLRNKPQPLGCTLTWCVSNQDTILSDPTQLGDSYSSTAPTLLGIPLLSCIRSFPALGQSLNHWLYNILILTIIHNGLLHVLWSVLY